MHFADSFKFFLVEMHCLDLYNVVVQYFNIDWQFA